MSILRSAFVMAVVGTSFVLPAARADDLAGTVAAKLRESGSLAGYRVNVKAKSGTVWLEGRVADQKQLAAAVSLAENTPGVERVVNRLAIGKQPDAPARTPALGMPSSAWGVVGMPKSAATQPAATATSESAQPAAETKPASRGLLAFGRHRRRLRPLPRFVRPRTIPVRSPRRRHGPCRLPASPGLSRAAIPEWLCEALCNARRCGVACRATRCICLSPADMRVLWQTARWFRVR
jgi:hypothetical protein